MGFQQGDCIQVKNSEGLFQIIAVDDLRNRCWLRPWPLQAKANPVFEESLANLAPGNVCAISDHRQACVPVEA
ncbi:MAG: hypothetical protein ERJ67_10300 [Aphanocapsa feldmannii 277cV]|uniref:DUF3104 domain-containing protein n=1 Tax=Aphanocapsa feldmannii 277cV TaxID=2507553 RepID=A0A524RL31_9CHRO|nr:MAG: hypothetical protein ERJ69_06015 [Aphanocapsa feldmannii 288cV]TGG90567.1 MAG: hypothetical protein ERJ67_10300 [Aphanocapsa feldmannii 277cV]